MSETTDSFDGEVQGPPPLSDEMLARIPARRGVALLSTGEDRPIQLLPAADMRSRVRNRILRPDEQTRRNMPDLGRITGKVAWKLTDGHFETDLRFFELARRLWPDEYAEMLAWKPPWFVHVDPSADIPHFVRTRQAPTGFGRYLGPFPNARAAERFCDILRDGFYLCRDWQVLRDAPNGDPCAYGQMGRCLGACHGRVSMVEYRQAVAKAAEFATGGRREHLDELRRRMREASDKLRFERAAGYKARLDRLAELDGPDYRHVAPLEEFRFVLVQPCTARKAKVFLADPGDVAYLGKLAYPPPTRRLEDMLPCMLAASPGRRPPDTAGWWRMGLVSRYLFSGPRRGGLILRLTEDLSANDLGEAIAASADALGLKEPG